MLRAEKSGLSRQNFRQGPGFESRVVTSLVCISSCASLVFQESLCAALQEFEGVLLIENGGKRARL